MKTDFYEFDREALLALADDYIAGQASCEQVQQLETLLESNPYARREYIDYALLHGQLMVASATLSSVDSGELIDQAAFHSSKPAETIAPMPSRRRRLTFYAAALSLATALLLTISLWSAWNRADTPIELSADPVDSNTTPLRTTSYDNRRLPVEPVAKLGPGSLGPTTLKITTGESRFASVGGADVRLEGPTTFGVNSTDGGVLYDGSVSARVDKPETTFSVQTSNLRFVDLGTEFRVSVVDHEHVSLHVLDGEVDVQSRVRLPVYFWTFDTSEDDSLPDTDIVSHTPMTLGPTARITKGIVGNGALRCDNTPDAFVKIEGGTGNKVGTGNLACSSGISIEAMIISKWSGRVLDYDEIFRKEDGIYRMLLSFQHDDDVGDYDTPEVDVAPCLSFGLHLEGIGYSELDMPLDGQGGRPTKEYLTDGKPHHVVATYDSYTGTKAIYVDGQLCFQHEFPVGTLILCGGPTRAEIGNYFRSEPFRGVIDEVAFYDFALTPAEIADHYRNAAAGTTYFGNSAEQMTNLRWRSVTRVGNGTRRTFNKDTGIAVDGL